MDNGEPQRIEQRSIIMIKTTQLKNNELKERLKKLSKPINEVVSMVSPTAFHNRMKPIASTLKSVDNSVEDDDEDFDLDEFISELDDEITLDEILHEMGYYDETDDEEELDEMKLDFNSKGYKEARKLIQKLRGKLFRELNDDDLETFVDTLGDAFGMKRI